MADQQFLASFGVDIDESGVSRLQKILSENRTLAESLSSAFDAASESVRAFREQVTTDLPALFSGSRYGNVTEILFGEYAGLKIGLNMTEPKKEMAAFTADAKKPIPLAANAAGIVSAARTALENVRSLFSETFTLNIRAETNTDRNDSSSRNDSLNPEQGAFQAELGAFRTPPPVADEGGETLFRSANAELQNRPFRSAPSQRMSTGGCFSRPTDVQVAEDGDAEYIIPVKKENRALPLLRQLLSELSPEARQNLTGENKASSLQTEPEESLARFGTLGERTGDPFSAENEQQPWGKVFESSVIPKDSEESSVKTLPPVRESLAAEVFQLATPLIRNDKEDFSAEPASAASQTLSEADRPLSATAVQLPAKPELLPASDAPLPPIRETLSAETTPAVSAPAPASAPEENSPNLVSELLSELKGLATPRQELAAVPQTVIKEDTPALPAPAQAPLPTEKKEEPALSAVIPDLRKTFADTDRPLTPVSATADRKESLPSDSALPKQNLSDLVSQLSAVLRPAGGTVNNTCNNLSAPVTINVNANGSDANRIGESIYDTAERYLLRTLRGAFA